MLQLGLYRRSNGTTGGLAGVARKPGARGREGGVGGVRCWTSQLEGAG